MEVVIMKKKNGIFIKIVAVFIALALIIPGGGVASAATDVPSDWAQMEVDEARSKGLVLAEADGNYHGNISRELFCMQIVNMAETILDAPVEVTINNPFDDTDNAYVVKAYQLGIVNGATETQFNSSAFITRQEIAAMMMRGARALDQLTGREYSYVTGTESIVFSDQDDIKSWALADIKAANSLGIMNGFGDNRISPTGNTTVEQSLLMINRLYDGFVSSPAASGTIISSVVYDSLKTYGEDLNALKANNGVNIGTAGGAPRQNEEDGVVFSANEGNSPVMPLAKLLDDVAGVEKGGNQAVLIKFRPTTKDFEFRLTDNENDDTKIGLIVGDSGEPLIFATSDGYMTPFDMDFRVEPGNWYDVFLAVDSAGGFNGAIWRDDVPENAAYFVIDLGSFENGERYKNVSWRPWIGFDEENTVKIPQYSYYTFSSFARL